MGELTDYTDDDEIQDIDELFRRIAGAKLAGDDTRVEQLSMLVAYRIEALIMKMIRRDQWSWTEAEADEALIVITEAIEEALRRTVASGMVDKPEAWLKTVIGLRLTSFGRQNARRGEIREENEARLPGWDAGSGRWEDEIDTRLSPGRTHAAAQRVFADLSPRDRAIVSDRLDEVPSLDVAARHGVSRANVDQIFSRFRRDVMAALNDDQEGPDDR